MRDSSAPSSWGAVAAVPQPKRSTPTANSPPAVCRASRCAAATIDLPPPAGPLSSSGRGARSVIACSRARHGPSGTKSSGWQRGDSSRCSGDVVPAMAVCPSCRAFVSGSAAHSSSGTAAPSRIAAASPSARLSTAKSSSSHASGSSASAPRPLSIRAAHTASRAAPGGQRAATPQESAYSSTRASVISLSISRVASGSSSATSEASCASSSQRVVATHAAASMPRAPPPSGAACASASAPSAAGRWWLSGASSSKSAASVPAARTSPCTRSTQLCTCARHARAAAGT